jgi:hypothetical protein
MSQVMNNVERKKEMNVLLSTADETSSTKDTTNEHRKKANLALKNAFWHLKKVVNAVDMVIGGTRIRPRRGAFIVDHDRSYLSQAQGTHMAC